MNISVCDLCNKTSSVVGAGDHCPFCDDGEMLNAELVFEKLQLVFDCAKDFLENHRSEVFGELTQDALESAIDAMNTSK